MPPFSDLFPGSGGASLPVYNVQEYGALGNGTGDDAPAVQRAVDAAVAARGGIIFYPAGRYQQQTTVYKVMDANTSWSLIFMGVGMASEIMVRTGAGVHAFDIQQTGSNSAWLGFERLAFTHRDYAAGVQVIPGEFHCDNAIRLRGIEFTQMVLRHLFFFGITSAISAVAGSGLVRLISGCVTVEHCGFYGVSTRGGVDGAVLHYDECMLVEQRDVEMIDFGFLGSRGYSLDEGPRKGIYYKPPAPLTPPPGDGRNRGGFFAEGIHLDEGINNPYAIHIGVDGSDAAAARVGNWWHIRNYDKFCSAGSPPSFWELQVRNMETGLLEGGRFMGNNTSKQAFNFINAGDVEIKRFGFSNASNGVTADANTRIQIKDSPTGLVNKLACDNTFSFDERNGVLSRIQKCDDPIASNTLAIPGTTDNRVNPAGAGADARSITGVNLDTTTAAGDYTRVVEKDGQIVAVKKDATVLAVGDYVKPSATAGFVTKAASGEQIIGRVRIGQAGGSGTLVTIQIQRGTMP